MGKNRQSLQKHQGRPVPCEQGAADYGKCLGLPKKDRLSGAAAKQGVGDAGREWAPGARRRIYESPFFCINFRIDFRDAFFLIFLDFRSRFGATWHPFSMISASCFACRFRHRFFIDFPLNF